MARSIERAAIVMAIALLPQAGFAAISAADIDSFFETRPRTYEPKNHSDQVLDILIAQLRDGGPAAASKELAAKWHIREDVAALVAEAEMRAKMRDWDSEQASAEMPEYVALYLQAIRIDPHAESVWTALRVQLNDEGRCLMYGIPELYFSRSGAAQRFLHDDSYYCSDWLLRLPTELADSPLALWRWIELLSYRDDLARTAASARLVDRLRAAGLAPQSPEVISALRTYWAQLVELGLPSHLLEQGYAVGEDVRSLVLDPAYTAEATIEGVEITYGNPRWLRDQWVLALAVTNRIDEARASYSVREELASTKQAKNDPHGLERFVFGNEEADAAQFVRHVLNPDLASDPFDLFIGHGDRGLLWSVGQETAISQRASEGFFSRHGYGEIARDLRSNACAAVRRHKESEVPLDALPSALREIRARYAALLEDEWFADLCTTPTQSTTTASRSYTAYTEKPLPVELRTTRGTEDEEEFAETPSSCVEDAYVVRCDTSGATWAAISISSDVDPMGEIGQGGYWLHLSHDEGAHWKQPIYLGLQQFHPYVVPSHSRLPLLSGSRLQLEVQVRELDETSITFPPVALRTKRKVDDLYIERPLEELTRDVDGDTLSDILEDKLRTDPQKADTDSDGLEDSIDTLPQISLKATPHPNAPLIAQVIEHILGYDRGAIRIGINTRKPEDLFNGIFATGRPAALTFLRADKRLFDGLLLPTPVILLEDADLEYLDARYGIHYPVYFPSLWSNKAGTKAVVQWSAGWVGGTLYFSRQKNGRWKSEIVSSWIT